MQYVSAFCTQPSPRRREPSEINTQDGRKLELRFARIPNLVKMTKSQYTCNFRLISATCLSNHC